MRRDRMRIRLRVRFLNDVIWFMMMFHMITTVASTSAFTNTKSLPLLSKYGSRHLYRSSLCMSANSSTSTSTLTSTTKTNSSKNIAIVGGGLAGLSTAYHLLSKSIDYGIQCPSITIIDKNLPGLGGASSVAGGLLHPFSPKGKLIHFGKEGLDISNKLIQIATNSNPQKPERNQIILRNQIYRIALTEKNVKDLQNTCNLHPEYATWLSSSDVEDRCGSGTDCFGGIVMTDGCKVVHVPSYLQGLWKACEELSLSCQNKAVWSLISSDNDQEEPSKDWWIERLDEFDTVIFSAGSGLFHDSILQQDAIDVPVELVRGQSVEMTLDDSSTNADDTSSTDNDTSPTRSNYSNEALLCGKYIAPLDQGKTKVLIGATHEYKEEPLNENDVVEDLRNRSLNLSHHVWKNGKIDRITLGYRVQSRRGPRGRMPIIGKSQYCDVHRNSWIFTGLSARGLIYHGVYGDTLSDAILKDDESVILERMPEAFWWKKTS